MDPVNPPDDGALVPEDSDVTPSDDGFGAPGRAQEGDPERSDLIGDGVGIDEELDRDLDLESLYALVAQNDPEVFGGPDLVGQEAGPYQPAELTTNSTDRNEGHWDAIEWSAPSPPEEPSAEPSVFDPAQGADADSSGHARLSGVQEDDRRDTPISPVPVSEDPVGGSRSTQGTAASSATEQQESPGDPRANGASTVLGVFYVLALVATMCFATWSAFNGTRPVRVNFIDSVEMDVAAGNPWWSAKLWFAPRPWLWVMSFKTLFHSSYAMVTVQVIAHFAAWLWLLWAIGLHAKNRFVRFLAVAGTCAFMAEPVITYWMSQILSESVSISLGAATLAAWLQFSAKRNATRAVLAVVVPCLWALQRDSNTVALAIGAMVAGLVMVVILIGQRIRVPARFSKLIPGKAVFAWRGWVPTLLIACLAWGATGIFIASSGVKAHRWEWAVIDQTILKADRDPNVLPDWIDLGMPHGAVFASQRRFAGIVPDWMMRPDLFQYQQWLTTTGRSDAVKVQKDNFSRFYREAIFEGNSTSQHDQRDFLNWEQRRIPVISKIYYPFSWDGIRAWMILGGALFVGALVLGLFFDRDLLRRRSMLTLVMATLVVAVIGTIFVSFQGDPYAENDRHLVTSVVTYRALWFAMALIGLDGLLGALGSVRVAVLSNRGGGRLRSKVSPGAAWKKVADFAGGEETSRSNSPVRLDWEFGGVDYLRYLPPEEFQDELDQGAIDHDAIDNLSESASPVYEASQLGGTEVSQRPTIAARQVRFRDLFRSRRYSRWLVMGLVAFGAVLYLGATTLAPKRADTSAQKDFAQLPGAPEANGEKVYSRLYPDISADGSKMVWVVESGNDTQIELLDFVDSKVTRLTEGNALVGQPKFSPDGTQIVYVAAPAMGAPTGVFVMDLTTKESKQVANYQWAAWSPTFTPDGNYVLFQSFFSGGPIRVDLASADGTKALDETKLDETKPENVSYMAQFGIEKIRLANVLRLGQFEFTPDGRLLASGSVDGNYELFLVDPTGTQSEQRLTNNVEKWRGSDRDKVITPAEYDETAPVMSPDGKYIVYCSNTETGSNSYDIFRMNLDGSNVVNLTNSPQDQCWPIISHDGASVIFVGENNGVQDLYSTPIEP